MPDTTNTAGNTYILEVYEAIRQLTAYYVNYSTGLQELQQKNTDKIDQETQTALTQSINSLRVYEKHAYIRLRAISEQHKINLAPITDKRGCLNSLVPHDKQLEELIIEYHKILSSKLADNVLRTAQQDISELTGNL